MNIAALFSNYFCFQIIMISECYSWENHVGFSSSFLILSSLVRWIHGECFIFPLQNRFQIVLISSSINQKRLISAQILLNKHRLNEASLPALNDYQQ